MRFTLTSLARNHAHFPLFLFQSGIHRVILCFWPQRAHSLSFILVSPLPPFLCLAIFLPQATILWVPQTPHLSFNFLWPFAEQKLYLCIRYISAHVQSTNACLWTSFSFISLVHHFTKFADDTADNNDESAYREEAQALTSWSLNND